MPIHSELFRIESFSFAMDKFDESEWGRGERLKVG